MAYGLRCVLQRAKKADYVFFLNNDTQFRAECVRTLVSVSQAHGRAVVGSILKDARDPDRILSLGPRVDYLKTRITEVLPGSGAFGSDGECRPELPEVIEMDALSGRGTLYPVEVFHRAGGIRHR